MEYACKSDVGLVRLENQDRVVVLNKDNFTFLVLCDGMGGHFGGALASNTTVNILDKYFHKYLPDEGSTSQEYTMWFKKAVDEATREMTRLGAQDEANMDMGTTVTASLINRHLKTIYIYNIGDSRTYVLTTFGDFKQVTKDHNVYNQLIEEDHLTPVEAKQNRFHAALTSALGPTKKTKIEVFDVSDYYSRIYSVLATSDGVHDFIDKPEMEYIMREDKNANNICEDFVRTALENKSTDNASAGLVVLDNKAEWR